MDKFLDWQLNPEKKPSEKEMNKLEEMKKLAGGKGS